MAKKPKKKRKSTAKSSAGKKKRGSKRKGAKGTSKKAAKKGKKSKKKAKKKSKKKAKKKAKKKSKKKTKKKAAKKAKKKTGAKKKKAKKKPKKRKRISRMSLQEVLISLATVQDRWAELPWLRALYLYGRELLTDEPLTTLSFMVVYRGLTKPNEMRVARKQLRELLAPALPLRRVVNFTSDEEIIEQIAAENPAVEAVLGRAMPIFVRNGE